MSRRDTAPNPWVYGPLTVAMLILGTAYAFGHDQAPNLVSICVPFVFVSLGALIKFGDQAFDEGVYDRGVAILLAIPAGLAMGALMLVDVDSQMIFTGLLLALFLSSKIDNVAFRVGAVLSGTLALIALLMGAMPGELFVIALIAVAGYLDEIGSDRASFAGRFEWVLRQRPFLKVMVLMLCITGGLSSFLYLYAFLGFDFGYSFVEGVSMRGEVEACTT